MIRSKHFTKPKLCFVNRLLPLLQPLQSCSISLLGAWRAQGVMGSGEGAPWTLSTDNLRESNPFTQNNILLNNLNM